MRGWTEHSGKFLEEALVELSSAGAAGFMIAEAGRDALREPPNHAALELAPPELGVTSLTVRVRIPVPVGPLTWRTVEKSLRATGADVETSRARILVTSEVSR